ncbi:hypothetical protein ERJ75_000331200 [Trypanosoma vivax]|uniref:Uncharacterized protein n=1 Tax=Trypanosoma vivax (strain Y486) TaxID=1055687 RepID=G0UAI6_TRYVY|nr:hypothetical protein TRVL_03777 [Trypanosoma vivax]KAH8617979.1 hypothetical protein ERJ75_000331200 [Trypanosoma vivax]CCC52819.1 conserved hypothetical protein [Trypanosoma vivax Y486]
MKPIQQTKRTGGSKSVSVLNRPLAPVPPPSLGTEIAVVGSSVCRLLRDARAVVRGARRTSTPVNTLPAGQHHERAQNVFPPVRGARLAAIGSAPSTSASQLLQTQDRFDPAAFLVALDNAKDAPNSQLIRLGELKHWLANPHRELWEGAESRLLEMIVSPGTEVQVFMCAASILLRCRDAGSFSGLPLVVRRLHEVCESGLEAQLLEELITRESLIQPLLQLLSNEDLMQRQTTVLWDILEILRCFSGTGNTVLAQMITLGMIPEANALVGRILQFPHDSPDKTQKVCSNLIQALLPPICLLYRNFSVKYSHHLHKLGSLDFLVDILERFHRDVDVVQAAARAMAKTVVDENCLDHYRQSTRACRAVVLALDANMDSGSLVVTRLCRTLASLVECSRDLRDWLMQNHHKFLLRLVETHVLRSRVDGGEDASSTLDTDDLTRDELLQGVTWLVGVAVMSAECSTGFVCQITPLLTDFLKDLDMVKWYLTFIHTLMCVSNLSFFFVAVEKMEGGPAELKRLYDTLGLILAGVMFDGDTEATVEATRALGNISLTNAGRDWIELNRCDEVCIVFLGHEDPRIVYNCFGVLLNLTAADTCRATADPDILKMLLQHTERFTRAESIAVEKERELRCRPSSSSSQSGEWGSYTDQIADVVEKLLLNISALV